MLPEPASPDALSSTTLVVTSRPQSDALDRNGVGPRFIQVHIPQGTRHMHDMHDTRHSTYALHARFVSLFCLKQAPLCPTQASKPQAPLCPTQASRPLHHSFRSDSPSPRPLSPPLLLSSSDPTRAPIPQPRTIDQQPSTNPSPSNRWQFNPQFFLQIDKPNSRS